MALDGSELVRVYDSCFERNMTCSRTFAPEPKTKYLNGIADYGCRSSRSMELVNVITYHYHDFWLKAKCLNIKRKCTWLKLWSWLQKKIEEPHRYLVLRLGLKIKVILELLVKPSNTLSLLIKKTISTNNN